MPDKSKTAYTPERAVDWLREIFQHDMDAIRASAERKIDEYNRIVRTAGDLADEQRAALADALNRTEDPTVTRDRTLERSYRFSDAERFVGEFLLEVVGENGPGQAAQRDLARDGRGLPASDLRKLARTRIEYHSVHMGYPPIDPDKLDQWVDDVLTDYAADISRQAARLSSEAQTVMVASNRRHRNC